MTKQGSKDFQKALTISNQTTPQNKLEVEKLVDFLVEKILESKDFTTLLAHQYGNYFCQKLFPRLKDTHKLSLWKELEKTKEGETRQSYTQISDEITNKCSTEISNFLWIASNSKGTHSLQVFLENLENSNFKTLISALIEKENPLFFAFNKHATHVLIKFIEITPEKPYLHKIYEIITTNFSDLSQDVNGLPLVKKCLAWIRTPELKSNMIQQLSENAILLAQNAYGNYSLQVAFDVSLLAINLTLIELGNRRVQADLRHPATGAPKAVGAEVLLERHRKDHRPEGPSKFQA